MVGGGALLLFYPFTYTCRQAVVDVVHAVDLVELPTNGEEHRQTVTP